MFRIGDFSRLSKVTARALRLYDRMGLLQPAKTDRYTGYRYYTAAQFGRLNRIIALKEMGFTLEEIRSLLADNLSVEELRGIFETKRTEVQEKLRMEQNRLLNIESRLRLTEEEGQMGNYEVVLRDVPSTEAVSLRRKIPSLQELGEPWQEMMCYLERHKIKPAGVLFTLYHDGMYKEHQLDVEVVAPVSGTVPEEKGLTVRCVPAARVAVTVHKGPYHGLIAAYGALMRWIEDNGYKIAGPERELYYEGYFSTDDPEKFVTEIQIPVEKM